MKEYIALDRTPEVQAQLAACTHIVEMTFRKSDGAAVERLVAVGDVKVPKKERLGFIECSCGGTPPNHAPGCWLDDVTARRAEKVAASLRPKLASGKLLTVAEVRKLYPKALK